MRPWDDRPRWQDPFVAAALALWTLFVFRRGVLSLPRGDQLGFLLERDRMDGTAAWLVHCLTYNRARVLTGEAHYLFRPLHSFTLGVEEVLLRDAPLAQGLFSLALHVAAAFALYRLVGRLAGSAWALLATAAFATPYAGMEMIVWRHIAPYVWAQIFLALGILRALDARPRAGPIAVLLLVACLAHETVPVALAATLVAMLAARGDRAVIRGIAGALLGWAALDLFDYALHPRPTIADPARALQPGFDVVQGVLRSIDMLGVSAIAWLAPSLVDLRWDGEEGPYSRLQWDFTTIPEGARLGVGLGLVLVLAVVAVLGLRQVRRGDPAGLPALLLSVHVGVLAIGFTAVRTAFRAYSYLEIATYYFYVTSFAFLVIAAQGLSLFRDGARRLVMLCTGGVVAVWTLVSYIGIQRALAPYEPFARMALSSAETIREALAPTELCFGGSFDPVGRQVLSPPSGRLVLFGSVACTVRRDAQGAYLAWRDGAYVLVTLPSTQGTTWPLASGPDWVAGENGVHAVATEAEGTVSAFAAPSFDAGELAVRMTHARDGGLWVGHGSMESYGAVAVFEGVHLEGLVRTGPEPAEPVFRAHNVVLDPSFELRVRSVDGAPLVFYDRQLVGTLTGASLSGRAGVFSHAQGPEPQVFSDLRIADFPPPEPVVAIPIALPALTKAKIGR